MYAEAQTFFAKVAWDQKGGFRDLMTAPYTYADATVAAIYGDAKPAADGRLTLDPQQRAGFVAGDGVLAQTAAASQAATVIHRGLLLRQRALCETPPPPPPDVQRDPAQVQPGGDNATARENYDLFKMAKPGCDACHAMFQPLGLTFEVYDAAGKFRSIYPSGKPIITTATRAGAALLSPFARLRSSMADDAGAGGNLLIFFTPNGHKRSLGSRVGFDATSAGGVMTLGDALTPLAPLQNNVAVIKGLNLKTPTF